MTIWKQTATCEQLNTLSQKSAVSHLGIEFTAIGEDWIEAQLRVDERTQQPFGVLHGGVSAALAETTANAGALMVCEPHQIAVGMELNISHLKSIPASTKAIAKATPLKLGREVQVWNIDIKDEQGNLCAVARLSTKTLDKR
ncbi:hotdog fold thioesterase [Mannheimia haemolytica]|uniref:hotdog fold thioesterase n=1 Tax=Mannheimia haemolytica TaxID=75985 RepID=UPI002ECC163B|nr:hotdog fold thioesterase [Mannheimia haemolytica]